MIPGINNLMKTDLEVTMQLSVNYRMHIPDNVISGTCHKLDAMMQVIYKILNTERYQYAIYSWNCGGFRTYELVGSFSCSHVFAGRVQCN